MKTITHRTFREAAALALMCALLALAAARGAEIKVVTSGAFTAAYLELVPNTNRPRTTNL